MYGMGTPDWLGRLVSFRCTSQNTETETENVWISILVFWLVQRINQDWYSWYNDYDTLLKCMLISSYVYTPQFPAC